MRLRGLPVALGLSTAIYFELPSDPALWLGPALAVRVPPAGDRLARTSWRSPTCGMTHPVVSDTRTGVFDFQCVASYQQFDNVGYVRRRRQ